jgi:hypothetical protein
VTVALAGTAGTLALAIAVPAESTVTWDYAAPVGRGCTVRNCSIADAVVTVRRALPGRLAVEHGRPALL